MCKLGVAAVVENHQLHAVLVSRDNNNDDEP